MSLEEIIEHYKLNEKLPQDINDLDDDIICELLEYKVDFVDDLKASRINFVIAEKLLELDIEEFIFVIDYVRKDKELYNDIVSRYIDKTGMIPEDLKFGLLKTDTRRKIIKIEPSYIKNLSNNEKNYFYLRRALCLTDEEILELILYFPSDSYDDYSLSFLLCNNFSYFKKLSLEAKERISLNVYADSNLDYKELSQEDINVIFEKIKEGNYSALKKLFNKKFLDLLDKERSFYFMTVWFEKCYNETEQSLVLQHFNEDEYDILFKKYPLSIISAPVEYRSDDRWKIALDEVIKKSRSRVNNIFWTMIPKKHIIDNLGAIINDFSYVLKFVELDSLADDEFWQVIEKHASIEDCQVKLFKEKFKPDKLDIVMKCFRISSLLASYEPLLNEINENNIGVFLTICPDIINHLALNKRLVYGFCLYDPNFVRFLFKPNFIQYLDTFLLKLFITKGNNVRLTEIPEEFLTEELVLLALQRSDKAVSKLRKDSITQMMRDVDDIRDKDDTSMIDEFKEKLSIIYEQQKKIDNYFKLKKEIEDNLPILIRYFNDSNISISKFCIDNNIKENLFRRLIDEIAKLEEKVQENYNQLIEVHKKEGWNYITDTLNYITNSLKNGVKSPEKDENIEFKSVLYYIYCGMDVDSLLASVKRTNTMGIYKNLKQMLKIDKPSINAFDNTNYIYKGKVLNKDEKEQIKIFMMNHGIPLDTKFASQVLYLWLDGHIDIFKKYNPTHVYNFDENAREDISLKAQKISMQRVIIQALDDKISNLKKEIEGVIKK